MNGAPPPSAEPAAANRTNVAARTAIWTGVALGAAATATVAFFVVRAMWQKRAPDETS
jgi:H+/gluconate symporter-like permease